MEKTLGSLFDGIGGFPLAGSRHGIKALWASEIEPFPIKVTKVRFPDMKHLGDVTKIDGTSIASVDIITFGSPCQDLSIAGKRAGLAGERSGLFMEAIRIIKELRSTYDGTNKPIRPRFAVWENVPGAFSSNKGEDFRAVLEEICHVKDETVTIPEPPKGKWSTVGAIMGNGYSIAWRILDAQYWGVPQRRRRVFLVADFGGRTAPEILFKRKSLSRHLAKGREAGQGIATDAERGVRETSDCLTPWDVQSRRIHKASGKWPALYGGEGGGHGYAAIPEKLEPITVDFGRTSDRIAINPKVSVTLQGEGGGCGAKTGLYCIQSSMIGRADKNGPQGDGINEAETSRTLDLNGGSPACNQGGMAIVQQINCEPSGISGTVSSKWAKGTGGPAGDEHYNLVIDETARPLSAQPQMRHRLDMDNVVMTVAGCDFRNDRENGNLCGTLQAKPGGGQSLNCIHPVRIGYSVRRLTPLECERLQGYPDGWTDIEGASDSGRYKALGNSVAIPCVEFVLEGISEVLDREQRS